MSAPARLATERTARPTRGGQVASVAQAMGRTLMPWQREVVDTALEYDLSTGLYAYGIVVVTIPRQGGKTTLEGAVAEHECLRRPRSRSWLTAQSGKEAADWFRSEHIPEMEASEVFAGRFKGRRAAGSEGVYWPGNGSFFRAFPPMRDALHGKQSDKTFVDEAWAHDARKGAELKQAIRPTMATRPGAQLWIVSTAGDDLSTYFREYDEAGREAVASGRKTGIAYFNWSAPEGTDPDDLKTIAGCHPAYGHTIGMEALEAARTDFGSDEAGWMRAFGNLWTSAAVAAIDPESWAKAGIERTAKPEKFALAFDAAADRTDAAIVAAWRDGQGVAYAEVVDRRPGTGWVANRMHDLATRYKLPVWYDAMGPSLDIADEIARLKPKAEMRGTSTSEFATSCAAFLAALTDGKLKHFRQKDLDDAAAAAGRRALGDRWAWSRRASTASISPLVAATIALRAFDETPNRPRPRLVVAKA